MVFFAEIAFIYGGNEGSLHGKAAKPSAEKSSEKIIKRSERSSETTAISSGTGSGTHPHKILDKPSGKDEHGDIHTIEIKRVFFSSYIKSQKQACDFYHKELLFR